MRAGMDPKWREKVVANLREMPIVYLACLNAGVGRSTYIRERKVNPAFDAACEEAMQDAYDRMEEEAWTRAVKGRKRITKYLKGDGSVSKVTEAEEWDSILLMFLLKGGRPEKYRDNYDLAKILAALQRAQAEVGQSTDRDPGSSPDELGEST